MGPRAWGLLTLGFGYAGGGILAVAYWNLPPTGWGWPKMAVPIALFVVVTALALVPILRAGRSHSAGAT
jgi:hypothetical protein